MSRLRTLRARLFGLGEQQRTEGTAEPIALCLHPVKAWTACTWQLGPKGKFAWLMRCRQCGAWFAC